jgi:cupin superfamily acireductone dioxygenase involved in methionine salvage
MNNEHVSTRTQSNGKNLGASKSRQEKTEQKSVKETLEEVAIAIKRWASRFFQTDPKTQHQKAKEAVEDRLRRHGFVKGVDGMWVDPRSDRRKTAEVEPDDDDDWWTQKRS